MDNENWGDGTVRNNCAFCHSERTVKDDNHKPECPYWNFF